MMENSDIDFHESKHTSSDPNYSVTGLCDLLNIESSGIQEKDVDFIEKQLTISDINNMTENPMEEFEKTIDDIINSEENDDSQFLVSSDDYDDKQITKGVTYGSHGHSETSSQDFDLESGDKKSNFTNKELMDGIINDMSDKNELNMSKLYALEKISSVKQILREDGINLENIPEVSVNDSYSDIVQVQRMLDIKLNKVRYSSITEELILMMSSGVETVFDGKKAYFGYKPNLSGWSDTVKIKLRKLKPDTSSLMKEYVFKTDNTNSITRILLELVPSMFLYAHMNRET